MISFEIALLFSFLILAILLFLIYSFFGFKSFITGAPPIPTPQKEIKFILEAIRPKKGNVFYDLGSGNGKIIIFASKNYPIKAIGIEFSFFLYFISKINCFISKSKATVLRDDYFSFSFKENDILYIYSSKKIMKKLEKKLLEEKSKVRVVSYCFSFPNIKYSKKLKSPFGKSVFLYQF